MGSARAREDKISTTNKTNCCEEFVFSCLFSCVVELLPRMMMITLMMIVCGELFCARASETQAVCFYLHGWCSHHRFARFVVVEMTFALVALYFAEVRPGADVMQGCATIFILVSSRDHTFA